MPSTYTTNLGIEKPADGEQSGTWGQTVNLNSDIIDQAINGIISVTLAAAGSSGSPNALAITDGTITDGRNKFIEFVDGGDLGATAYVRLTPNDAEKIVHIRNSLSGSRSVILFQGTYNASNDFEVPNGKDVLVKFSGTGTGATVTDVFVDLQVTAVTATSWSGGGIVTESATQTLTNKTLTTPTLTAPTITGAILNDGYTEEVFAVTGTTPALSPTNGSIQTWTLSANSTPTAGTWAAGQSLTILIDDGTDYTITWTTVAPVWKTDGGSAPTLNTSGDTVIVLWKVGSTIYGARVGDA
jgi:hypothetical protein